MKGLKSKVIGAVPDSVADAVTLLDSVGIAHSGVTTGLPVIAIGTVMAALGPC